ncbi:hypothetical protein [Pseudoblastomonas halimionae]|uniref:hypothetical protein n=1 Tax=Alteriqipengyuania halimionae TaxID=1926630 RepID=UPI0018F8C949|nr:hypothetical protein [Alteriqipengyuania halimionae]
MGELLITRLTVFFDTPARVATSLIVGVRFELIIAGPVVPQANADFQRHTAPIVKWRTRAVDELLAGISF